MAVDLSKIKIMTNLADSGQDAFVENWVEYAKVQLYERGISNTFINGNQSTYIIAKVITDLIEDGDLSTTTNTMIATLSVNHSHDEDNENV